jgi:hypothetical protein
MSPCAKKPYPTRWNAERALIALLEHPQPAGRKRPAGIYPCYMCRGLWHLTSKRSSSGRRWLRSSYWRKRQHPPL